MLADNSMICPCCKRPMPSGAAEIEMLLDLSLSRRQREVLEIMVKSYPREITMTKIIDYLYGADPSGGPLDPQSCIFVFIHRLRKTLPKYGWTIPLSRRGHAATGRYKLERIT